MTDQNKQEKIVSFIQDKIENKNKIYFKSKEIAQEVQLTSHEVGSNLRQIKNQQKYSLDITKFSKNTPTTWKITPST